MAIKSLTGLCCLIFAAFWVMICYMVFDKWERGIIALLSSLAFIVGVLMTTIICI